MSTSASLRRTYIVECYVPGIKRSKVEREVDRVRAASAELREEGLKLEYAGAILVPGDEVVFHIVASEYEETVREASVRASLSYERVVEFIAVGRLPAEKETA